MGVLYIPVFSRFPECDRNQDRLVFGLAEDFGEDFHRSKSSVPVCLAFGSVDVFGLFGVRFQSSSNLKNIFVGLVCLKSLG